MPRSARYEFVGGPLDADIREVPMGLDGGPAGEVYVELRLSPARMAVGDPTISPARFTGPWVAHRLKVNPATDLRPPTCWPWATSATRERAS
jgi:hypothetical protein